MFERFLFCIGTLFSLFIRYEIFLFIYFLNYPVFLVRFFIVISFLRLTVYKVCLSRSGAVKTIFLHVLFKLVNNTFLRFISLLFCAGMVIFHLSIISIVELVLLMLLSLLLVSLLLALFLHFLWVELFKLQTYPLLWCIISLFSFFTRFILLFLMTFKLVTFLVLLLCVQPLQSMSCLDSYIMATRLNIMTTRLKSSNKIFLRSVRALRAKLV